MCVPPARRTGPHAQREGLPFRAPGPRRSRAGVTGVGASVQRQRTRTSTTTHLRSQKTACEQPPPRPTVAGRLPRKRNSPPQGALHALQCEGRACGRLPSRACWSRNVARSILNLDSIADVKVRLTPISNAPSNPFTEVEGVILDLIKCIACVVLPTNRPAIRFLLPNLALARALLVPETTVHLHDYPSRRHTWVAPAFVSRVMCQRIETRLATFDSIGLVLIELCLLPHCPLKQLFILRRLRQQPCVRQHLRTSHQCIFMVLGVCSFSEQRSAIVGIQLHSWRSWTVSTNWRRLKPTCTKSQNCDATGSEGRSEFLYGCSFAARNALRHTKWYDTCAAAMTDDFHSSASTSVTSASERITMPSKTQPRAVLRMQLSRFRRTG